MVVSIILFTFTKKIMDKLGKILFTLLITIVVLLIVMTIIDLSTSTKQERVERAVEIVYLDKHKYLIYTTSKNDCLIHSEECEICKNNHQ